MNFFSTKIRTLFGAAVLALSLAACGGDSGTGGDDNTELSSSSSEITLSSSSHTDVSDPLSSSSLQENSSSAAESSSSTTTESSSSGEEVSSSSMQQSSSSKEPESSSSSVNNMCGSLFYDVSTQFCAADVIYDKCGGKTFNPADERCSVGEVKKYGTFTDSRDGKIYKWVEIGAQTWMAENLNYVPETGNSLCYDDDPNNCDIYGRLYDWDTAMEVCPEGWHLPSIYGEWDALEAIGNGTVLKSKTGWNGTDDYGFSALPGGYRGYDGSFGGAGTNGYWWSATEGSSTGAYGWSVSYGYYDNKAETYAVRCVKD